MHGQTGTEEGLVGARRVTAGGHPLGHGARPPRTTASSRG
jgi:hypothetical protein